MSDIRPPDARFPLPRKDERIRASPSWPTDQAPAHTGARLPECRVSLVGRRLRGRRGFSKSGLVFALLTLLLLGVALANRNYHWAILAALPAALACTLTLARPPAFSCSVSAEGLEMKPPPFSLRYEEVEEILAPARAGTSASFPIEIYHGRGFYTVPARLDVASEDLYCFLVNQPRSVAGDRTVPAVLSNFLRLQESLYGAGSVWIFRTRASLPSRARNRTLVAIGLALFGAGVCWGAVGLANAVHSGWFAGGSLLAIVGVCMAFAFYFVDLPDSRHNHLRGSCLVVSPGGMALVQGPLKGELKWQEVRALKMRKQASFSRKGGASVGLLIKFAGASILLPDIYHRPLRYVHDLMESLWAAVRGT
jgi:hypothetical protein